jgi:hypothetical protein
MKSKVFLFIIMFTVFIFAQESSKIPIGSRNNIIKLSINNTSDKEQSDLIVYPEITPEWVKFMNQEHRISKVESGKQKVIVFEFDILSDAPEETGIIKFNIVSSLGKIWTKTFNIELVKPIEYELLQNYPNPFNPSTEIKYSVKELGLVSIKLYDMLGREVSVLVNEVKDAGLHSIKFDGSNLASGVYMYSITVNEFNVVKKMILNK